MKSNSTMKVLYSLLAVLFLGILIADGVLAKSISVDRVRWKYNWCCWTDHDEYLLNGKMRTSGRNIKHTM